jgi:hypothetical protein
VNAVFTSELGRWNAGVVLVEDGDDLGLGEATFSHQEIS